MVMESKVLDELKQGLSSSEIEELRLIYDVKRMFFTDDELNEILEILKCSNLSFLELKQIALFIKEFIVFPEDAKRIVTIITKAKLDASQIEVFRMLFGQRGLLLNADIELLANTIKEINLNLEETKEIIEIYQRKILSFNEIIQLMLIKKRAEITFDEACEYLDIMKKLEFTFEEIKNFAIIMNHDDFTFCRVRFRKENFLETVKELKLEVSDVRKLGIILNERELVYLNRKSIEELAKIIKEERLSIENLRTLAMVLKKENLMFDEIKSMALIIKKMEPDFDKLFEYLQSIRENKLCFREVELMLGYMKEGQIYGKFLSELYAGYGYDFDTAWKCWEKQEDVTPSLHFSKLIQPGRGLGDERLSYLLVPNKLGEQALLKGIFRAYYGILKTYYFLDNNEILISFSDGQKISVANKELGFLYVTDIKTGKMGVYSLNDEKLIILQEYDSIEMSYDGLMHNFAEPHGMFIVSKDGNLGRIDIEKRYKCKFECQYSDKDMKRVLEELPEVNFSIPIEYDEIVDVEPKILEYNNQKVLVSSKGNLVLVRKGDKWGAYCYLYCLDSKLVDYEDDLLYFKRVKITYIEPLFDKIEMFMIEEEKGEMILRVWLGGKMGLFDVGTKKFLVPTVFDEINYFEITGEGKIYCEGIIDGVKCIYDGEKFVKTEVIEPEIPLEYVKVRSKIKQEKI